MADVYGSNYTKEKIDATGKAEIGEVVSKVRCSLDSWSGHAQNAGEKIQLLAKIPAGAVIKDFEGVPALGAGAIVKLIGESGEVVLSKGLKVTEESDIILEEDGTGGEMAISGKFFVEFLLD